MVGLYRLEDMIRRELKLNDGAAVWLLVSQVEHARMSGELVRNWREEFSPDVVEAIAHHDDGWADVGERAEVESGSWCSVFVSGNAAR